MKLSDINWWKIYLIFFATISTNQFLGLFSPKSETYVYYHTLMAFHDRYDKLYYLAVTCSLLNILSSVPLIFYLYGRMIFNKKFWQGFLILRVAAEVYGHHYEFQMLKSFSHTDLFLLFFSLIFSGLFLLPSYLICLKFALPKKWEKKIPHLKP